MDDLFRETLKGINDEYNRKYSNTYFGANYSDNSLSGFTAQDEDALKHGWLGRGDITHEQGQRVYKRLGKYFGLSDSAADSFGDVTASIFVPFLNSSFSRWLTSLATGTTDTIASGLLNIPGLALGGLGKASEYMLGGNSMFTDASKTLFDWDAGYKKLSKNILTGAVGTEPTFTDSNLDVLIPSMKYVE